MILCRDTAADNATLMEKQKSTLYDSKRFLKAIESEATFGSKETCQLNGSKVGGVPLTFHENGGTNGWNAKPEKVLSKDNDGRTTDSSSKEDQNGLFYHLTCQDGDSDLFSSGSPSKSSVSEGITKDSDPEGSMQKGEAETFIVSTLPIQEFSTRFVLKSFLDSLDIENNISVADNEIPSDSAASSAESESYEDVQARNTSYNDALIEKRKQQPAESRDMHEHKNAMVDKISSTIQIQSISKNQDSENNECQGESSFSASGHIAFSGPIGYSGSISLRSDCSATSARSFAFPILQSEWNSSPVTMAKADERQFRKHKSWTSGLLCCRF